LVDGISLQGFNIVDIEKVSENIGKPVIAVTSNKPNKDNFRRAMKHSSNYDERFESFDTYRNQVGGMGNVSSSFQDAVRMKQKNFVRNSCNPWISS